MIARHIFFSYSAALRWWLAASENPEWRAGLRDFAEILKLADGWAGQSPSRSRVRTATGVKVSGSADGRRQGRRQHVSSAGGTSAICALVEKEQSAAITTEGLTIGTALAVNVFYERVRVCLSSVGLGPPSGEKMEWETRIGAIPVRFVLYQREMASAALAALKGTKFCSEQKREGPAPNDLQGLLAAGTADHAVQAHTTSLLQGEELDQRFQELSILPPLPSPEKIICFGLNYKDHASESGFEAPKYPALFGRFPSSLIGHGAPIVRPRVSDQLDYEGELVAIIGKPGRNIPVERALDHVIRLFDLQ